MAYFVPGVLLPSVESLRSNTTTFGTAETVVFGAQGSYFWKVDSPLIGEQFGFLSDVSVVDFGGAGIIQNATDLGGITLFQVSRSSTDDLFMSPVSSYSTELDSVVAGQFPSFTNNSIFNRMIVDPGRSGPDDLPEFYLRVEASVGIADEVFGPFGIDVPNDGRALIVRGQISGQRDAAWGSWLDTIQFNGPGGGTVPGQYNALDPSVIGFIPPDELMPVPSTTNSSELVSGHIDYAMSSSGPLFTEESIQAFKDTNQEFVTNLMSGVAGWAIQKVAIASLSAAFPGAGWVNTLKTTWDVYSVTQPLIEVGFQSFLHDHGLSETKPTDAQIQQAFFEAAAGIGLQLRGSSGGALSGELKEVLEGAGISTYGAVLFRETDSFTYSFFTPSPTLGAVIQGGDRRDLAFGSLFADNIDGGAGDDRLFGFDGDDFIQGGAGNDAASGGAGFDTAVIVGASSSYTIDVSDVSVTVSNGVTSDILIDIERIRFDDQTINVAINDASLSSGILNVLSFGEQLEVIYAGYFNRAADGEGFAFWSGQNITAQAAGQSAEVALTNIANSFQPQPETLALYPALGVANPDFSSPTTLAVLATFIEDVYQNLFNRTADADGQAYWVEQVSSGAVGFGATILAIANGAIGNDALIILNKAKVALDFTDNVTSANIPASTSLLGAAKSVLDGVNGTHQSVFAAQAEIDAFVSSQPALIGPESISLSTMALVEAENIGLVGVQHPVVQDSFGLA